MNCCHSSSSALNGERAEVRGEEVRLIPESRGGASPWKSDGAGKPLLLTHIFECVAPSAESQRDSATKPRVARNELPWENARDIGDNPERVVADDRGNKAMPQPRWGCESSVALPRVARSSQPWAELHNPFGIEDTDKEQRLAGAFSCPVSDRSIRLMSEFMTTRWPEE